MLPLAPTFLQVDAIGGRRFSEGTSADREIQRTLMELLSQLDGFDVVGKVGRGRTHRSSKSLFETTFRPTTSRLWS